MRLCLVNRFKVAQIKLGLAVRMHRLSRRRHSHQHFVNQFQRSFSSDQLLTDSFVLVEGNASSRTAILNRPSVLNALNTPLMSRLHKLYESWEDNPDVGFVVMKGSGNAFCAGADIVSVRDMIKKGKKKSNVFYQYVYNSSESCAGNIEGSKQVFRKVYSFAYLLHTYLKPNVAILDGVTMGGGAAISIPGTFRIATNKTVYATPETLIGLHPDAGASFHLSHLPGYLGEYLGLTGDRLNGVETLACGLATHYSHSTRVKEIEECLKNLVTDDPSVIETSLEKYTDFDFPDNNSVLKRMEMVDKCFSQESVEEIIEALESEAAKTHDGWCESAL
ncbi:3-hydroxyisobutyryl-CoA hydrolase-like protein 1, mitochondrial [Bidens hawaiensis]|uniref:3-hydroxyisobutyryl-CoA hydrolase-like protein 1, mitochondrial n=1 Tax=Bidens hawaiensis TaxID=980011 RepID=UPI00404A8ED6